MSTTIQVRPVETRRDRRTFVTFPWRVYRGDSNWVPPLISDRMAYLDPEKGPFFQRAEVGLFLAQQGKEVVGTIAAFVDPHRIESTGQQIGGFGFFECLPDQSVAARLLEAAGEWLNSRGMTVMSGPTNFTDNESPGVLVTGVDCPPVMLEAHTPLYYKDLLEACGMEKDHDLYAWRALRAQVGDELSNIPPELNRVAEAARKSANATIRKLRLERWEEEIKQALALFNATLTHIPDFVPMTWEEFKQLANPLKPFIDPDLALFAEVDGKPIGFCVAIPDLNRVLIHLNGRLFPFGWLKLKRLIRQIDVVTFKLMGVLEQYRHRGVEAMLFIEAIRAFYDKGYAWLDGSVTSEYNPMVNLIAHRLGAERYKHYRIYQKAL